MNTHPLALGLLTVFSNGESLESSVIVASEGYGVSCHGEVFHRLLSGKLVVLAF